MFVQDNYLHHFLNQFILEGNYYYILMNVSTVLEWLIIWELFIYLLIKFCRSFIILTRKLLLLVHMYFKHDYWLLGDHYNLLNPTGYQSGCCFYSSDWFVSYHSEQMRSILSFIHLVLIIVWDGSKSLGTYHVGWQGFYTFINMTLTSIKNL